MGKIARTLITVILISLTIALGFVGAIFGVANNNVVQGVYSGAFCPGILLIIWFVIQAVLSRRQPKT